MQLPARPRHGQKRPRTVLNHTANLSRLVLGCIDASDSVSSLIFQDLNDLHTSEPLQTQRLQIFHHESEFGILSEFCIFKIFGIIFQHFVEIFQHLLFFFDIFTEFCRNCGKFQVLAGGDRTFQKFQRSFEPTEKVC